MTKVRQAMIFFSICVVIGFLAMAYGIVRSDLAVGLLGAVGLPVALSLVGRAISFDGEDSVPETSHSPRDRPRRFAAWRLLLAALLVLFLLNLATTADARPSRAVMAGAEVAGLAAGTAFVFQRSRSSRM